MFTNLTFGIYSFLLFTFVFVINSFLHNQLPKTYLTFFIIFFLLYTSLVWVINHLSTLYMIIYNVKLKGK